MIALIILVSLFIASRVIIFVFPPHFSDVMYSYYHYARIWTEGYPAYLVHLFEYPPANIILFYLPWILDRASILGYPDFYRFFVFLADVIIFIVSFKVLKKLKLKKGIIFIALLYYILALTKAKDFVYDSMDLVFISGFFLSLALLKLKKQTPKIRFFSWFFFWLSTAFKYITAPLFIPYLLLMRKGRDLKKEILISFMAFVAVWGLPLIIFRSSLSVTFVYHLKRGFQVESMPANVIRLVNRWTQSDSFVEVYKNYDIIGPVTAKLQPYLSIIFPLTMLAFFIYSLKKSLDLSKPTGKSFDEYKEKLKLGLIYLFLFMATGKVFSTPFHLWLPPLLTIYPFKSVKQQLKVLFVSFFMIAISMTPIPNLTYQGFELHNAIGLMRPICLLYMLIKIKKT
ncbi:hypothetical protein COT75_01850 [Candidatus Beckwithbacteria bacterium CG10_big_fil_rev_8_21_14_0_10_34_10]|uniref:Glycosyltransferase RgtA/B/C/D-like domain-containing protein n=1 Tax=Candidatus Beckwithbacteria bacterium CG10_big_fil_rev_8_21_14_0_10_34_10 TaxID=1974495 RepID=A0A2H0W9S2_9BACT|nr:MAG: hypothetical protein COT75_01850 [Candidatus Beckwithbacteria bacterium CG10_big_fil_rev_8_21_14_0_10_34_10]